VKNEEILNKQMECFPLLNNYFEYIYTNDNTFGILEGKLQIEVKGGLSDSVLTYNHEDFIIDAGTQTLLIKFNDSTTGYVNAYTTVTLTTGTVTASTLVSDINTAVGLTVASVYIDDNNYRRIRITPPTGTVQNVFIGASSTCLDALGLTGSDEPAILNGPLTTLKFTATTGEFYQLNDISDQLKLMRYTSGSSSYLINVPVVVSSIFNSDPDYYLDKIVNFITSASFSQNRMVTDNVQCRFLNSYFIESPFIESIFLQGGQIFFRRRL
jgi:hypothetical protein